jgi:cytidylate kinase
VAAKRAVTISRQSGCGSHVLAEKLAGYLQARTPPGEPPWTIFDRNLMEEVLAEHHLPAHIAKYMPEDRVTEIADIMDELFGLRPASWALVEQTAETILHLAEVGNVILLGRGANLVTAKSPGVVHVRLIAPLETRVAHMQQFEELSRPAAAARVRREDLGRRRYINKYFQKDVDDPLLYHLVINTDSVPLETAARLIGELVLRPTAA